MSFVSDIAVFVLKRDVKLQLTHSLEGPKSDNLKGRDGRMGFSGGGDVPITTS